MQAGERVALRKTSRNPGFGGSQHCEGRLCCDMWDMKDMQSELPGLFYLQPSRQPLSSQRAHQAAWQ